MRKVIIAAVLVLLCGSTFAFAETDYKRIISPADWNEVNPDELSREELVEAFNALRKNYSAAYGLYTDLLEKENGNSSGEEETEVSTGTIWEKNYFIDEFERPTDEAYIFAIFEGKFSNSVITDKYLTAKVLVTKEKASIFLYAYGDTIIKNPLSDSYENKVMILDDKGEKHKIIFTTSSGGDRMTAFPSKEYSYGKYTTTTDPNYENFIKLLQNNKSLYFSITNRFPSDKYIFSIENIGNFNEQYNALFEYSNNPTSPMP